MVEIVDTRSYAKSDVFLSRNSLQNFQMEMCFPWFCAPFGDPRSIYHHSSVSIDNATTTKEHSDLDVSSIIVDCTL